MLHLIRAHGAFAGDMPQGHAVRNRCATVRALVREGIITVNNSYGKKMLL